MNLKKFMADNDELITKLVKQNMKLKKLDKAIKNHNEVLKKLIK